MLSFVLVLLAAVAASVQGKCDGRCSTPLSPYEEIGCEPVFAKPDDCCPSHYNCAKIEGRSADKCYYQGNVYNKGEQIPTELTSQNCLAACFCSKNRRDEFTCAHIDCPEFLGGNPVQPGCYRVYELNNCCSIRQNCLPKADLAKCEVNNETYYDGQKWYDEERDLKCVCGPNFTGKLEEPFCKKISCGIELLRSSDVHNRCAPVFYGPTGKCPIQWNCYSKDDKIIANPKGVTTEQKCQYGTEQLNIGDRVLLTQSTGSPKIDCECKIPPLITCIQQPHQS